MSRISELRELIDDRIRREHSDMPNTRDYIDEISNKVLIKTGKIVIDMEVIVEIQRVYVRNADRLFPISEEERKTLSAVILKMATEQLVNLETKMGSEIWSVNVFKWHREQMEDRMKPPKHLSDKDMEAMRWYKQERQKRKFQIEEDMNSRIEEDEEE